jgi:hypothetical protein
VLPVLVDNARYEMKVILIDGENDYDAILFESRGIPNIETWELIKRDGYIEVMDCKERVNITAKALEFGEVDKKFINFIKSEICDYDSCKTKDFFVVV